MTIDEYRGLLRERVQARARYAELAADVAATLSLSAPAAAPVGIGSTGEPACTVHTSYLGIPSISLPLLRDESLPLGLQVAGFADRMRDFATRRGSTDADERMAMRERRGATPFAIRYSLFATFRRHLEAPT